MCNPADNRIFDLCRIVLAAFTYEATGYTGT